MGKTGPAIGSCCGFAEGDPLSVVAMYLVNIAMTVFLRHHSPCVTPISFVDDWQLLSDSSQATLQGYGAISQFTDSLDLVLDHRKSFVWGSSSEGRVVLRESDFPVKYHSRNLGGHVSYCGRFTNYTVKNRGRMLEQFWMLLKNSLAPTSQKLLALKVVAWPRALHAASFVRGFHKSGWAISALKLCKPWVFQRKALAHFSSCPLLTLQIMIRVSL